VFGINEILLLDPLMIRCRRWRDVFPGQVLHVPESAAYCLSAYM